MYKKIFLLFILICTSSQARDIRDIFGRGGSSSSKKLFSFRMNLGGSAGYGSVNSEDNSLIPKSKMMNYGVDGLVGIQMGPFLFAGGADYTMWDQTTKPSEVGNINTTGKMKNTSGVFGLSLGPVEVIGRYHLKSTYEFTNKDSSGNTLSYSGPESSYTIQLLMHSGLTYYGVDYKSITYSSYDTGGVTQTTSQANKATFTSVGFVLGISL